jgi:hypothetical protein
MGQTIGGCARRRHALNSTSFSIYTLLLNTSRQRKRAVFGAIFCALAVFSILAFWHAKKHFYQPVNQAEAKGSKAGSAKGVGPVDALSTNPRIDDTAKGASSKASPSSSQGAPNSSIAEISKLRSSRDLVEFMRRTNDVVLQEYAIRSVGTMCKTLAFTTGRGQPNHAFGMANPARTEQVLRRLMDENRVGAASLRERCSDFASVEELQSQLNEEAARSELPLAKAGLSIGELGRTQGYTQTSINEARSNLDKLLAGGHPAAMMFVLSSSLVSLNQLRLAQDFSGTDANDWPLGPVYAAYQIAACRTRTIDCGVGTVERDTVCARYGECQALDVESSYRRLFELYGIPFTDTDRLAAKFQQAIVNRDAATLLP